MAIRKFPILHRRRGHGFFVLISSVVSSLIIYISYKVTFSPENSNDMEFFKKLQLVKEKLQGKKE